MRWVYCKCWLFAGRDDDDDDLMSIRDVYEEEMRVADESKNEREASVEGGFQVI